jgi:hypothetical protein
VIKRYVAEGKVQGYVLFRENIYGSAVKYMYREIFPPGPNDEIIVSTDLDMTIPANGSHWLRSMIDKFNRFAEIAALSLDLDLSNWNPQVAAGHKPVSRKIWSRKYGIYRFRSGGWFLAERKSIVDEYIEGDGVSGDSYFFRYLDTMFRKPVYGRLPIYCHHLSWDLETSAPDYIKDKYDTYYTKVYQRHACPEYEVYRPEASTIGPSVQAKKQEGQ